MTLAVQSWRVLYNGDGSQVTFAIPQTFFSTNTNIVVVVRNPAATPPSESTKTASVDYNVTGTNVVFVTAPAAGLIVAIFRSLQVKQELDLIGSGVFNVESLELELDKIVAVQQQQAGDISRALKVQSSAPDAQLNFVVDSPMTANATIVVNDAGTGLTVGPEVDQIQTWSDTAAAAATSASTSATSATTSATAAASSATAAAASATTATTKASQASSSATAASNSASDAALSDTSANTSATAAGVSATNAANSATAAAGSATTASTAATTATTQATNASTSATNAATSATAAAGSATSAATSATAAAGSATAAAASAASIQPVPPGGTTGQALKKNSNTDYDTSWGAAGVSAHSGLTGLTGSDDHTQYALLAGRSGGQTVKGDTASGGNLSLSSTAHATKGKILLGSASAFDEASGRLGLRTTSPAYLLSAINTTDDVYLGSINCIGQTNNDYQTWAFYAGNSNTFAIFNKQLNSSIFGMNYLGQMGFGAAAMNHPSAWFLFEARDNSYPTIVIKKNTSQTTDPLQFVDTDEVTKLFYVTITGKVFASGLDAISARITNVADPTSAQDAATKSYVDIAIADNSILKDGCIYATVAALPTNTYSNGASGVGATLTGVSFGALSVDGNVVVVGQRILVKNEAAQANNGIYTVTTVGAVATLYVLTRATDYNTSGEILNGTSVFIASGSTLSGSTWAMNQTATVTVGTTAITFAQTSSSGSASARSVLSKSADYTVLTADFNSSKQLLIAVTGTSAVTLTLPAASNSGYDLIVKNAGTGVVTVARAGSDTIDGDTSYVMIPGPAPLPSAQFLSDGGTAWYIT